MTRKKLNNIEYPVLHENLFYKVFDNGLEAYVIPKPGFSKSYVCIGTRYGSANHAFRVTKDSKTTDVYLPDGVAHFLEHKLFEQPDMNVLQKFAALGARPNAYTSFDKTVYLFSCTDMFKENLELLLTYVQQPWFTDENVEKEKGIIGQEIDMYADNADWRVYFNLIKGLYSKNPIRMDIAGTKESIAKINKEILYQCHEAFYQPSNMTMIAVGDVDPEVVFDYAERYFGSKESNVIVEPIREEEQEDVHSGQYVEKMSVSIPKFMAGFKDITDKYTGSEGAKRQIAIHILLEMLLGKSSKTYNQLYEQGLINATFGNEYSMGADYAFSSFGGESEDPDQVIKAVMDRIEEINHEGLDKSGFDRIKKAKKGSFLTRLDSMDHLAHEFINMYFQKYIIFDYFDLYDKIDFDYTVAVFKEHFRADMLSVSKIQPL